MSTDAQKRASTNYNRRQDNIMVRPSKEEGAIIRAAAAANNQSVQAFILQAVRERIERESVEQDTTGSQSPEDIAMIGTPEWWERHRGRTQQVAGTSDTINQSGVDSISGEERTYVRPIVAQSPIQSTHHELTDDDFPELSHEDLAFLHDFNR